MKIGVFAGSFDPITRGHEDIVLQALPLFDVIIVAIGVNIDKKYAFPLEQRIKWIDNTFAEYPKVKVVSYEGLTVDLCRKMNAGFIIRGLRNTTDFEYESIIAEANKKLNPEVETVFFLSDPTVRCVSSTVVRDLIKNNADLKGFIPEKAQFYAK
ncbi:MAG: pantetheine-phosphate adenylyltransferase [Bacteroidales bacterium]|nr:pantetheine-phosphate adenylyltransferase [Bacteroidales bacterium]